MQSYRLTLLFLLETKIRDTRVRNFMWSLGYSCSYAVSNVGRSGGLALFCSYFVTVSLKAFNSRCIDVHVKPEVGDI